MDALVALIPSLPSLIIIEFCIYGFTGFSKLCYACLPLIFDKIEPVLKSIINVVTTDTHSYHEDQVSFCKYNNIIIAQ